eukprot:scaffold286540_cov36-Tisochrysis_lutea.AAC.4
MEARNLCAAQPSAVAPRDLVPRRLRRSITNGSPGSLMHMHDACDEFGGLGDEFAGLGDAFLVRFRACPSPCPTELLEWDGGAIAASLALLADLGRALARVRQRQHPALSACIGSGRNKSHRISPSDQAA